MSATSKNPTLAEVQENCFSLDTENFVVPEHIRLISPGKYTPIPGLTIEQIEPGRLAGFFKFSSMLYHFFWALRIFLIADKNTVIVVTGGGAFFYPFGLLNRIPFFRRRTILLWGLFVEYLLGTEKRYWFFPFCKVKTSWKEAFGRFIMRGYSLLALWSKKQVKMHAAHYNLPESLFFCLPFKADHSKMDTYDISMNNFIFTGGNSKRDYQVFVEAIRDTGIPVIMSVTDPKVKKTIEPLPNLMILGAQEPTFKQLQAASRFVVVPLNNAGFRGAGEANFCNAGWHRKPIIAVDNISAEEYIIEGETGFVVPCGDAELLRKRILQLWKDPELCREMGLKGREHIEKNFTHAHFVKRLLRLALILGEEQQVTS